MYLWDGKNNQNVNHEIWPEIPPSYFPSIFNKHRFSKFPRGLVYKTSAKLQNHMNYVNDIGHRSQNNSCGPQLFV